MTYVDGFLLPVKRTKLKAYTAMARKASKIWKEHGALEYKECVGEDDKVPCGLPFPKLMKLKAGEVPVFAFIVYRSRAHRDKVNAKVMKDSRMSSFLGPMPFDMKRMGYGGFKTIVEA
jgi:uncharacterized protein YbaA (DUF1428 family)